MHVCRLLIPMTMHTYEALHCSFPVRFEKYVCVLYNDEYFVQVAKYCIVQVQVQVVRQNWN